MAHRFLILLLSLLLAACAAVPPAAAPAGPAAAAPEADAGDSAFDAWQHRTFPGKQATEYVATRIDGRPAVAVQAESSASMLRQAVRIEPAELGRVRFSWKVPALIAQADLAQRDKADSPVRVLLAFEGDRSKFSMKDAMLSELAQVLTGEPLPYATLMYVWSNTRAPGSVIASPRTERIRKLVVESGSGRLNRWLDYERDVRADFERAFGEPPGALVGVAIMTDTDNTRTRAHAWYGPVQFDGLLTARR